MSLTALQFLILRARIQSGFPRGLESGDLLSLSSGARVSAGQWRVFAAQGLFLTLTSVVLLGTVWLSLAAWEVIALSHSIKLMLALHPANEAF